MEEFKISWQSPSNIAIVKYWGKEENQIPMNPSFSFTLDKSKSITTLIAKPKNQDSENKFFFDGIRNDSFGKKSFLLLEKISKIEPWLHDYSFEIYSKNTFPHSAGIASSASSMSALALCLTSLVEQNSKKKFSLCEFNTLASEYARIGSGSASRSIYPKGSIWGQNTSIANSSNAFAIDWSKEIHPDFLQIQDAIFLVNRNEKSVSSSAGHELMNQHHYRASRIVQANQNLIKLLQALKTGDWNTFVEISEEEALTLHGLMMSSNPGYVLLEGDSIRLVHFIRKLRSDHGLPVCFTIDAGPNIHMLYPLSKANEILDHMKLEFPEYFSEDRIIFDCVGEGPVCVSE